MAKNQIYPYAVARIRMLERTLLTEKNYIQMAEAKNIDDALKVLSETGYSDCEVDKKNFETVLSDQLSKAYSDIKELVSEENFMDVFLFKNDYHNLKVLIKSDLTGTDGSNYLIDGGTIPLSEMKNAFATRSFEALPADMTDAISEAYDVYGRTQNGQMIDIIMDKAAFRDMKRTADKCTNNFVKKYVEYVCDITNLKSFLRIKNMNKTFEVFADVYVDGGSLSLETFRTAFSAESPATGLRGTQYGEICTEGMPKGFTVFEKLCDNFIMAFIREAKFRSLTLEPMVAYAYARETEAKIIRIILSGKLNNIDVDVIKERLRDAYV
ncbi:MAG: V-type ATP synthase subunit C [Lachnospiraceae bacterium]|nr:V-type ATP synthase subunit C [Lachnospiraceae bacterium]